MRILAPSLWRACVGMLLAAAVHSSALAEELPPEFRVPGVRVEGLLASDGESVTFGKRSSRVVVSPPDPKSFRIHLEVEFAPSQGLLELTAGPATSSSDPDQAAWRTRIRRKTGEESLLFQPMSRGTNAKWTVERSRQRSLQFQGSGTQPGSATGAPTSWGRRWWRLGIERAGKNIRVVFDGQTLLSQPAPATALEAVVLRFASEDRVRGLQLSTAERSAFVPIELGRVARHAGGKSTADELTVAGIPFRLADQGRSALDLRDAKWPDWKKDPSGTREGYDLLPTYADPNRPMLWAATADYAALHLLLSAKRQPETDPGLSITIGSFGEQVRHYAFQAGVPTPADGALNTASIPAADSPVVHVSIPLHLAIQQELPDVFQIAFNKQLRLAVRQPDPSRFRYRPLGLPSNVRVWAATLELSPLQMEVHCDEPGNAFVDPAIPTFRVRLENVTAEPQRYMLHTVATHLDGHRMFQERSGELAAGARTEISLRMPVVRRGYYDYRIELRRPKDELLLVKSSSFVWLMPASRPHRKSSPFGTWDFSGAHFTSADPKLVGALHEKLGFRYGMFGFTAEERAKSGVVQGREPVILGTSKKYFEFREKHADAEPVALLMHEHAVSRQHLHRVPDIFHDRGSYALNGKEQVRFQELFSQSESAARALRAEDPKAHLRLGNGNLPLKEEFYRAGFPAELFDSGGNEAAVFGRPPEAQPPDIVAMNASLWMDRRLLDHYGYSQKPVTQCFETCYPSTNPGNLSRQTQADYFVRHALHGLAWRLPNIRLGMIMDAGNSYYHSNWGASGLCTSRPEVRAKPAFVALATLTAVLDGATFERELEFGSPSLYGLEFAKHGGGRVLALWTVRGRRLVSLRFSAGSAESWALTDGQGNSKQVRAELGKLSIDVGPSPTYLEGTGRVEQSDASVVDHSDANPIGATSVLSTLGDMDDWLVDETRDMDLEFHNPLTPRRKGVFAFEPVSSFEGEDDVIRVTPADLPGGVDTMPMYGALRHRRGLILPGRPNAIGLWVNGNSSFGRVIFHLEDAAGQRWLSIGANSSLGLPRQTQDLIPQGHAAYKARARLADWNTDDVFGLSRFDFDGWRYVSFPLPGNYPGEGYGWPANSQWMHDRDGQVRYPLKLRRLIIELPPKTLHIKTFSPAPRSAVYLKRLIVEQSDSDRPGPLAGTLHRDSLQ